MKEIRIEAFLIFFNHLVKCRLLESNFTPGEKSCFDRMKLVFVLVTKNRKEVENVCVFSNSADPISFHLGMCLNASKCLVQLDWINFVGRKVDRNFFNLGHCVL